MPQSAQLENKNEEQFRVHFGDDGWLYYYPEEGSKIHAVNVLKKTDSPELFEGYAMNGI